MLQVVWETAENIAKSKSSIDFFLSGCHCKTGCGTRICSCKKKGNVARVAPAIFLKIQYNLVYNNTSTCTDETDLVIKELLDDDDDESYYVEASDDDLDTIRKEEMDKDKELKTIMGFVFGLLL